MERCSCHQPGGTQQGKITVRCLHTAAKVAKTFKLGTVSNAGKEEEEPRLAGCSARSLAALAEDPVPALSTHMVACNHL